jgi:hypothetical protein
LEKATESGIEPGHPGYLGAIQRELTKQWKDQSSEVIEVFQTMADEWSSGKAPDDVKSRQVILTCAESLYSCFSIQDGSLHAAAHYLRLSESTVQDLWGSQCSSHFIYR